MYQGNTNCPFKCLNTEDTQEHMLSCHDIIKYLDPEEKKTNLWAQIHWSVWMHYKTDKNHTNVQKNHKNTRKAVGENPGAGLPLQK